MPSSITSSFGVQNPSDWVISVLHWRPPSLSTLSLFYLLFMVFSSYQIQHGTQFPEKCLLVWECSSNLVSVVLVKLQANGGRGSSSPSELVFLVLLLSPLRAFSLSPPRQPSKSPLPSLWLPLSGLSLFPFPQQCSNTSSL